MISLNNCVKKNWCNDNNNGNDNSDSNRYLISLKPFLETILYDSASFFSLNIGIEALENNFFIKRIVDKDYYCKYKITVNIQIYL